MTGAENELKTAMQRWDRNARGTLHKKGLEWRFNPPRVSHMGGVWERQIQSVRNQLLDDERLHTLFCEAKVIVNSSRTLTQLSNDPVIHLQALTPTHLIRASWGW
ncbi:hypothetical protein O3P69_014228 [Scylla paramamosain]|uniref:Uncharacterized protein n=1 Tax=Scylla paramamosain TaxID=85552 RepID=A0AAW0SI93_SCYPA